MAVRICAMHAAGPNARCVPLGPGLGMVNCSARWLHAEFLLSSVSERTRRGERSSERSPGKGNGTAEVVVAYWMFWLSPLLNYA
eukprot:4236519-Pleurochrysis_carterae.AAC.1